MKAIIIRVLKNLISWLNKVHDRYSEKVKQSTLPYTALSPLDDADITAYETSLRWALDNRKKHSIHNIALTGPYGSGKSSILKTFIKHNSDSHLQFLSISLATFKEIIPGEKDHEKQQELLRLIELSILQQIFFHEEDSKIPDSRFKKIKSYSRRKLWTISISLFLFVAALFLLITPEFLTKKLNLYPSDKWFSLINYASVSVCAVTFFWLIFRSIRVISSLRVNKLEFQNASIEMDEKVSSSILNHHLDEILYFFEVRPYNVVIIEDLDRFEQTEIFTKLREINKLLNDSKKIKKDIVFIYAVRDDMFKKDKDRTKFFEFIIPVIPVINFSNSSQKLMEKRKLHGFLLKDALIEDISLFIDDMRLLHNIINEFYLYHQRLQKTLSPDKLLAILVYKNIFPRDFTMLAQDEGELFKIFDSKRHYIQVGITEIDAKISQLKLDVHQLEQLRITDVNELRKLYLATYIDILKAFDKFSVNGVKQTLNDMTKDENFEYLVSNNTQYHTYTDYNGNLYRYQLKNVEKTFADVEKLVGGKSYEERLSQITEWNNNKVHYLKEKIKELEEKKLQLRHAKMIDLINSNKHLQTIEDKKQKNMIGVLLRNGYIDEDYIEYISIFYEGSLTQSDYLFLMNVKSQVVSDFEYSLSKINNLIKRIAANDFESDYVLNYDLLDYVLNSPQYSSQQKAIIKKLSDSSVLSLAFIEGYVEKGKELTIFFKLLSASWPSLWTWVEQSASFTNEKKTRYLEYILSYADTNDIKKLNEHSGLVGYIMQIKDFLSLVKDIDKLKGIIHLLSLKFVNATLSNVSQEVINYIYQHDHYALNPTMISRIIRSKGKFDQVKFDTSNYAAIETADCPSLKDYIKKEINQYLESTYLKIDSNTQEEEEYLITLLNEADASLENKTSVIKQVNVSIDDLSDIDETRTQETLLNASKVKPTWENMIVHFNWQEKQISNAHIAFVNVKENAAALGGQVMPENSEAEPYELMTELLLRRNDISNESYELMLPAISSVYLSNITDIHGDKRELLVEYDRLVYAAEMFTYLKTNNPKLTKKYIEQNKSELLENVAALPLDGEDVAGVLRSPEFSLPEKSVILKELDEGLIKTSSQILLELGSLILRHPEFDIENMYILPIITNSLFSEEARITIFNLRHQQLQTDSIAAFFDSLGEPYAEINIKGKRPLIPLTVENLKLAGILSARNIISSYDQENKGVRIVTYKKPVD